MINQERQFSLRLNEEDMHLSSEDHEENSYVLELDLLILSY